MTAWIFQGNPDRFDLEPYLATTGVVSWSVRQVHLAPEMRPGDRVYIWRASGRAKRDAGILCAGRLVGEVFKGVDEPRSKKYWVDSGDAEERRHIVKIQLDPGTDGPRRLLSRRVIAEHPLLKDLHIFKLRNLTNYQVADEHAVALETLWNSAPVAPPFAWLLMTLRERQHAGNQGYEDVAGEVYRYDSLVPNSRRIQAGDVAVLRGEQMLGLARITKVAVTEGVKPQNRCPSCNSTSLKKRSTLRPKYRCDRCKDAFDDPLVTEATVKLYEAKFGDTYLPTPGGMTPDQMRDACPVHNNQHAMQRIDLGVVVASLKGSFPDVDSFLASANETADSRSSLGLARTASELEVEAEFDPRSISDARKRTLRAIAVRAGQPQFRRSLLEAYGCCAISRCSLEEALEAAHITPYLGPETNRIENGLLLRADLHTLFDRGLITVDPESYRVVMHPRVSDPTYVKYSGIKLCLPNDPRAWPRQEALALHREEAGI